MLKCWAIIRRGEDKHGCVGKDAVTIQEAEIITVVMGDDEVVVEERRWSRDASGRLRCMMATSWGSSSTW